MNPTHRAQLIALACLVVIVVSVATVLVLMPRYRYTPVKHKNGTIYLVDNFTGKVRGITPSGYMFDVTDIPEEQSQ